MTDKTKSKALKRGPEIAPASGPRDITRPYIMGLLLNQDTILQTRGRGDLRIYEDLKRDDQVKATFEQRRSAVTSHEWLVEPGGDKRVDRKAADALRENLRAIDFDNFTDKMLWSVYYGYSVAETLYCPDGNLMAFDDLKVRDRRRFRFAPDGELRMLTQDNMLEGEVMDPRYVWHVSTGHDNDDQPYGLGLGHWLYWPVLFKRQGLKFWQIYMDKYAMPTAVGKFQPSAEDGDIDALLETVVAIQTEAGVVMPEDMTIELMEAKRAATSDYKLHHDTCDAMISKIIVGQTMTTDDGSSRSQSETHMKVRQDIIKADADLICEAFNHGPVKHLTEFNFPNAALPRVYRDIEEHEDLGEAAKRDATLYTIGYKPKTEYIVEKYGDHYDERDMTPPPGLEGGGNDEDDDEDDPPASEFAENEPDHVDAAVLDLEGRSFEYTDQILDQIRQEAENAKDLPALRDKLLTMYSELDTENLGSLVALAMATENLDGRSEVADGQ